MKSSASSGFLLLSPCDIFGITIEGSEGTSSSGSWGGGEEPGEEGRRESLGDSSELILYE